MKFHSDLNPEAGDFIPYFSSQQTIMSFSQQTRDSVPTAPPNEELKAIIESQNEDIIALKLLYFEQKIEANKKSEEIKKLKEVISDLFERVNKP